MLCDILRGACPWLPRCISGSVGKAHDSLLKAGQRSVGEGLGLTLDLLSRVVGEPLSWGMPSASQDSTSQTGFLCQEI